MASIGFRWLDILEKEFDKAFVELDLTIGEWESEEPDVVFNIRQKLCTLSSCFAQLTHKAQAIFQNSAKIEAELIHMRAELVESKSKRELLGHELHNVLLQLHAAQLSHLPESKPDPNSFKPDVTNIRKKLEAELRLSPIKSVDEFKLSPSLIENAQNRIENAQLQSENASLRNSILQLNSEVYGAKLAAKYLDKELAGRIQQLQLLGREMRGEVRDKLWRQLESEILLQRHKTVVRACRRNSIVSSADKNCLKPANFNGESQFAEIRSVVVKRKPGQGLGISITGGREHGVPILISELEERGPAALTGKLFIGDAILHVNEKDLRQACHKEAVDILQQQTGDCVLQVQYIAADDSDNSLEEENYNFRFFENFENGNGDKNSTNPLENLNTPTAPRTPESNMSRCTSGASIYNIVNEKSPAISVKNELEKNSKSANRKYANANTNKLNIYHKVLLDSKITNASNRFNERKSDEIKNENLIEFDKKSNFLNKIIPLINKEDISMISDILLADNSRDLIRFDDVKACNNNNNRNSNENKIASISTGDNFNSSLNSLTSDNFSSPMQTSTDNMILDSEIQSQTDVASNDSQSPKNQLALVQSAPKPQFDSNSSKKYNIKFDAGISNSNESICNPKSDQSLLNSEESCDDLSFSPVHRKSLNYRKLNHHQRKKKKYFGVKTLQSIFNKHDGYSDVSTTASDFEEDKPSKPSENTSSSNLNSNRKDVAVEKQVKTSQTIQTNQSFEKPTVYKCKAIYTDTSPQFEENVHNILSDIFVKNFPNTETALVAPLSKVSPPIISSNNRKYFSFHGQNLRVGKALRLCPNENALDYGNEQRKEKLLARYVYNSNATNGDGVGDPFFGTPV